MGIRPPEMILYHYFLSNYKNPISFSRIKDFIERLEELSGTTLNASGIVIALLRAGSIEQVTNKSYGLSPSCLVQGNGLFVGVNLSYEIKQSIAESLISENGLGLGIYKGIATDLGLAIPLIPFRFENVVSKYRPLRSVLKDAFEKSEEIIEVKGIDRYDPIRNVFVPASQLDLGENLYRMYAFGQHHFYYLYQQKNTEFSEVYKSVFERSDLERLSIVKTMLGLNAQVESIVYLKDKESLVINPYQSFPVTIEKLLYLNHILINGTFPPRRMYHLSPRSFVQLQRLFNNKIIINHGKHIPNLERD